MKKHDINILSIIIVILMVIERITISCEPPTPLIGGEDPSMTWGCVNCTFGFDGSDSYDYLENPVVYYEWEYPPEAINPTGQYTSYFTCRFATASTYTIKLRVMDELGNWSQYKAECAVYCAKPTYFHQVQSVATDDGRLHFLYNYNSTSGYIFHLAGCKIGEYVDYPGQNPEYYWPSPPWQNYSCDPTDPEGDPVWDPDPTIGVGVDVQGTGVFLKPYTDATFTATQIYRYKDYIGNYTPLTDIINIDRYVGTDTSCPSGWRYLITKSGRQSTVCLPP